MGFSWETRSAASTPAQSAPVPTPAGTAWQLRSRARARSRALAARGVHPELVGVMALAGMLNLWALSRNGWANLYYSAAVRSMSSSWHDFLFASLDRGGVMTVDKPPLALWVQALSVRVFGYHPLSVLVPQALMGVASVALVYDLVRRRFRRVGGFVAGLALALTPITVAISRHNNPDALLVLCCVAAVWCAVRALEGGRTRWLVAAGVCVGLGFETKMLVALVVVPGIAAAWLWISPAGRGRVHALRQLLAGGAAMLLVGGAWPLLVELTPASARPWISGTSDNRILSLIFEYNGVGRVDGQAGGPGGGGGNMFGGTPGPLRLLNSALGGQAGWLLGFATVAGLAILAASRLRRADARSGWLLVVGGAALSAAVLFSAASGILHPYYVSLLAPFVAALTGAGAAQLIGAGRGWRVAAVLAAAAGVAVEIAVRNQYPGQLPWLVPVLLVLAVPAALVLLLIGVRRVRVVALAVLAGALLLAPSAWALDTLGHATSGTFPAGGPASVESGGGGPFGSPGGLGASARAFGGGAAGATPRLFGPAGRGSEAAPPAAGAGPAGAPAGAAGGAAPGGGAVGGGPAGAGGLGFGVAPGAATGAGPGAGGGPFGGGGASLQTALSYAAEHGGGTVAVSSQSAASSAIVEDDANVAGIGGFSGRESDVSVAWLAQEVRAGKIRWVLDEQQGGAAERRGAGLAGQRGAGLPGDTRAGARAAMAAVARECVAVTLPESSAAGGGARAGTLYDCSGRADQLARAGA